MKTFSRAVVMVMLGAVFAGAFTDSVRAGNTWDGGGVDNYWGTAANWNPDGAPGYGTLTFSGTTRPANTNNSITAMNQVNWNGTAAWIMGGTTTLSVYDNGGTQAKIESLGSGGVTIDAPITFAANNASPPNPFGEINAVGSDILFSGNTLTVNGSSCNGIKLWGTNNVTFNNTVSAGGKWFGMTTVNGAKATIGGTFTSGDFYVMNGGTLNLASGGSLTTSAVRIGGDFGNTGNQNQTLGGTFVLAGTNGGQTFSSTINTPSGNTSGALAIYSANTAGTNTITGGIFLDSPLRFTNAAGGTLALAGTLDVKSQTGTFGPAGTITVGWLSSSFGTGTILLNGPGTLNLLNATNNFTGTDSNALNAAGTRLSGGGTLIITADTSLGLVPANAYNNIQFTGSGTLRPASSLDLAANRNVNISSGAIATLSGGGNTLTLPGIVNGSGSVVIGGGGTVVLTGNNTYSGGTAISPGTLRVNGQSGTSSGTGTGSVFINSGGRLSGNGRIAGPVVVANSPTAVLYPNSGGPLTISNSLTFSTNSTAKFDLTPSPAGANDKVVLVNNSLSCGGASLTINLTNANLSTADYVLFDVGASGAIIGAFNATPVFTGTPPKFAAGYSIVTAGKTVVLRYTPIPLTVTAAADTRIYDGTTNSAATPAITSGALDAGDAGSFTQTFDNRNAGAGKTLTPVGSITNLTLGNVTARYNVTFVPAAVGTINPRPITVTAATDTKTYDGTTNSTATPTITLGTLASGDSATWTQTFDSKNAGARTLAAVGSVTDGNSGNNYSVTFATANGTITTRTITVTAAPATKGYDGTTNSAGTPTITSGSLAAGDSAAWIQTFDNKNVGARTLTPAGSITDGNSGSNYSVLLATASGTINPRAITVTAATDTKTYDGTTNSTGMPTITSGSLAAGDSAVWTQTFDSPNAGSRTLTPSGSVSDGNGGNNYSVTFGTAAGSITAAGTALALATSTNLSQLNASVTFTATVAPAAATGDVVFKSGGTPFGTNTLAGGMALFSLSSLAGGTNTITAEYAGDGNYSGSTNSLSQVVNRPPVANNIATNITAGGAVLLDIIGGTYAPSDADGDVLTVSAVSTTVTTNGGIIAIIGGTNITYTATNGWSGVDGFTYTVDDGRGGSATASVTVNVTATAGPANITSIVVAGGYAIITAQGTAGASYSLQFTGGFNPIAWQETFITNVADGSGIVTLTNAVTQPVRFYRTKYTGGP